MNAVNAVVTVSVMANVTVTVMYQIVLVSAVELLKTAQNGMIVLHVLSLPRQ